MEPPRSPYKLRSHDRVLSLRSRQVSADTSSTSTKPSAQNLPQESKKPHALLVPKCEPANRSESEKQRLFHCFLETFNPYPLWAMQDYNKRRNEGEQQYTVSKQLDHLDKMNFFREFGSIRVAHFEAKPTSLENPDLSATKRFFARVHQLPNNFVHVSDCYIYPGGPPKSGTSFEEINVIGCKICGLETEAQIMEFVKLREDAKARKLKGEKLPELTYDTKFDIPPSYSSGSDSCCGSEGPVAKSAARYREAVKSSRQH